jgi:Sel1 repeat
MNDELRRFVDLIDSHQGSEAEAWARGRAEGGDADAQFLMGYLVFGGHVDFRGACDWFQKAAAQNHAEALFQLSRIDQSEDRWNWGPPRTEQMRTYLRRAADLGSVDARTALARFLADGRGGFPKDEREAKSWYEKAAGAGDVEAQSGLSWMLMRRMADPVLSDNYIAPSWVNVLDAGQIRLPSWRASAGWRRLRAMKRARE